MPKIVKREKRTFSGQFKRDAVNLVVIEGCSFAADSRAVNIQVSASLGLTHSNRNNVRSVVVQTNIFGIIG